MSCSTRQLNNSISLKYLVLVHILNPIILVNIVLLYTLYDAEEVSMKWINRPSVTEIDKIPKNINANEFYNI